VPIYCFSRSGIGVDSIGHMTGIGQRLCGLRGTHGWSAVLGIRNVEFLTGHILRQLDPKKVNRRLVRAEPEPRRNLPYP
jgi:hypothetical protein